MHKGAMDWCKRFGSIEPIEALDVGARDVNGNAREFWPNATWTGIDLRPGPNVDVVADAAFYDWGLTTFNLVLCTEVLEHAAFWVSLLASCKDALRENGLLVLTTAGPGRAPHSATTGHALPPGEHYLNIPQMDLERLFRRMFLRHIIVVTDLDIYLAGWR